MRMLARLRRRLTLLAAVLTGCVVLAVAVVSFLLCASLYTAQRQAAFEAAVAGLISRWETENALDLNQTQNTAVQNGLCLYFEENGQPLVLSGLTESANMEPVWQALRQAGFDPELPPLFSQTETVELDHVKLSDGPVRLSACKQTTGEGWRMLIAWQPLHTERQTLGRAAAAFSLVAVAGIGLLAAICWCVAGRAIQPVRQAMEQQKEFVRAAGHELRTPLGVLRAGLAVLPLEKESEIKRHIGLLDAEAARMGRLIDELLILSGGGIVRSSAPQLLEPDTLLLDLAEAWEPAAHSAGRRLQVVLPPQPLPPVRACREELCQILSVFLDNALRYAPEGTAVELYCAAQGRKICWEVRDHGPGIPDQVKEVVFQRFWRADASRSSREHFGLGLSVAQELAGRCGVQLGVSDTPGGGATFRVEVPRG